MNRKQALMTALNTLSRQQDIVRMSPVLVTNRENQYQKPSTWIINQEYDVFLKEVQEAEHVLLTWLQELYPETKFKPFP